jgi:hypothetical protein
MSQQVFHVVIQNGFAEYPEEDFLDEGPFERVRVPGWLEST